MLSPKDLIPHEQKYNTNEVIDLLKKSGWTLDSEYDEGIKPEHFGTIKLDKQINDDRFPGYSESLIVRSIDSVPYNLTIVVEARGREEIHFLFNKKNSTFCFNCGFGDLPEERIENGRILDTGTGARLFLFEYSVGFEKMVEILSSDGPSLSIENFKDSELHGV